MYHMTSASVAADRTVPERSTRLAERISYVARRLLFGTSRITAEDRQYLGEVARTEQRYPMKGLDRLVEASARADSAADAEALPEAIRGEILARRSAGAVRTSITAAIEAETITQAEADVAEFRYLRERSETNRRVLIEKLTAHMTADRQLTDALHAAGGAA